MSNHIFLNYVLSGYPLLWVETYEEHRALTVLAKELGEANDKYQLFSWDRVDGIKVHELKKDKDGTALASSKIKEGEMPLNDPMIGLKWAETKMPENSVLVLLDYHHYAKKDQVSRQIRNLVPVFKAMGKVLAIVSHTTDIPHEIEKEITVINFNLPDIEDLQITLKGICESAGAPYPKDDRPILEAALGMTSFEAENAFALSLREEKSFNVGLVNREKAAIVKKTGLLEVIEVSETINDIGGLDLLKGWLAARENCFTTKAKDFGIKPPKGLLLIGVPGTGKSLSAKVVANILNRPLLRLDMGKVFGSFVGESESNIRKCLNIAEAVAPCLTEDSNILLADGSESTIKELYEIYPNGGFEVVSFDTHLGQLVTSTVLRVTKKVTDDSYRMTYSDGESVGYSWNHLQPVMRDGRVSWIKTENVNIGDYVAIPMGDLEVAPMDIFSYLPPKCRFYKKYTNKKEKIRSSYEEASIIACGSGGYTDSVITKWPSKVNNKILYLLGLIMSDGSISKSRVSFTNTKKELTDAFKSLVKDLFNIDCSEFFVDETTAKERGKGLKGLNKAEFSGHTVVHFQSKSISYILKGIIKHLRGFDSWKIKSFLAGYLDGDGCILPGKYPRIVFCSKNKKSRYLIKSLLKRINIIPSKGSQEGITVSGAQTLLLKNLSLSHTERKRKLSLIEIPEKRADRIEVFPIGRLITEMRENLNISSNKFSSVVSSEIHAWEHNKRPIPVNKLKDLISELYVKSPEWAQKLQTLIDTPLRWMKVTEKKKTGKKEVYDLCCENTHNFLVNGILTHNCCLWIDELEKSFAGLKGGNGDGHGTSKRVFSTFLTWLQEKKKDVFIVATANDVNAIPPEMIRGGRFDKIFWVDLPGKKQREEIIDIHIRKIGRKTKSLDMKKLVTASDKFTGAEIEVWVQESLVSSFGKGHELCTEDMLETSKTIIPISQLMAEDIETARQWAVDRGVTYASEMEAGGPVKVQAINKTGRKITLNTVPKQHN